MKVPIHPTETHFALLGKKMGKEALLLRELSGRSPQAAEQKLYQIRVNSLWRHRHCHTELLLLHLSVLGKRDMVHTLLATSDTASRN